MIVIDQGGEWLWQKVQNIPNSLKRMQYGIAWIILSCHFRKASENLGVSESALKNWMKAAKEHKGEFLPVVLEIMQVRKQKRLPDCSVNYEIRRMLLKC